MNLTAFKTSVRSQYAVRKKYFTEQADDILKMNLIANERMNNCAVVAVLFYMIVTKLFLHQEQITILHFIFLGITIIQSIVATYVNRVRLKSKTLEKFSCIFCSLSIFIMLILGDTLLRPHTGQVFCSTFLVIAPAVFIMNISRMVIDEVFLVTLFAAFAYTFKPAMIATEDMYAIFTGFVFGSILYLIIMELRIQVNSKVIQYKSNSETDELTQIENRRASKEQIQNYLSQKSDRTSCAMMILDVDFFKQVNDTYGHEMGDVVLKEVANVLRNAFRKTDVVSRFGGDEFLVFIAGFTECEFLKQKCNEIETNVRKILSDKMSVSCSIGVCVVTNGKCEMEDLIHVADQALYETKERQRGTDTIYIMTAEELLAKVREKPE